MSRLLMPHSIIISLTNASLHFSLNQACNHRGMYSPWFKAVQGKPPFKSHCCYGLWLSVQQLVLSPDN